ncbi:hypothetical protein [Xylanimonas ulmi]|uniref:Uncharacterized protein n=1 Tax=Xylanimonas ulmi TaxID=228973 RepID=A0A4Q7M7X4_9MICO|nr:hypothetical protein [Xylanibacterium ulmi]RZS62229.1 hypothetical protein EV386_2553 [Xylanibacterium ulmi]
MTTTDDGVETFDVTRTLRDAAQHRLRRTTTIGEALYHQATAKAAALAILAEFPEAVFLELDESDQDGSDYSPGAILSADGAVIAADSFGSAADTAVRWNNLMDLHYGPLTDLPDEFEYDYEKREAVPPYPWLVTVENDRGGRIGRLDLRVAAEIDLNEAVAEAFPTAALPDLPRHLPGRRQLTGEEIAALAIDAVVVPAALIDTGARHHVPLPAWPVDRGKPSVAGGRTSDGVTHLTVSMGSSPLLSVRGTWNGERYSEEYSWYADYLTLTERDQVEAWTQAVWVRLTDAMDNVVDHAVQRRSTRCLRESPRTPRRRRRTF